MEIIKNLEVPTGNILVQEVSPIINMTLKLLKNM
jgi:hypothetical protein